jgi:hypothetical protein
VFVLAVCSQAAFGPDASPVLVHTLCTALCLPRASWNMFAFSRQSLRITSFAPNESCCRDKYKVIQLVCYVMQAPFNGSASVPCQQEAAKGGPLSQGPYIYIYIYMHYYPILQHRVSSHGAISTILRDYVTEVKEFNSGQCSTID